jgi:phosphohistidine phosphatase
LKPDVVLPPCARRTFHHRFTFFLENTTNDKEQRPEKRDNTMADNDPTDPPTTSYTTNAEDQREAEKIQARLRNHNTSGWSDRSSSGQVLPNVVIADGAHKYVLLSGTDCQGDEHYIVTSLRGAHYHRNAAEPMIAAMEQAGYTDITCAGGGRISCDLASHKISIFGFSYGFGKANHAISQSLVQEDPRYKDCEVTISDEGY